MSKKKSYFTKKKTKTGQLEIVELNFSNACSVAQQLGSPQCKTSTHWIARSYWSQSWSQNSDITVGCDAKSWKTPNVRSRSNDDRTPKNTYFCENCGDKLVCVVGRNYWSLRFTITICKHVKLMKTLKHSQNNMEKYQKMCPNLDTIPKNAGKN